MPKRPPHERHIPSSDISRFIDFSRIERLLAPWMPEGHDRAFVTRCILGEGPAHHRGANFVLLALMEQVLQRLPREEAMTSENEWLPVKIHVPPHLAPESEVGSYPLGVPVSALERLAPRGSREFDAMVDCLTDGPPHHALANVAMVTLLEELLARLPGEDG